MKLNIENKSGGIVLLMVLVITIFTPFQSVYASICGQAVCILSSVDAVGRAGECSPTSTSTTLQSCTYQSSSDCGFCQSDSTCVKCT